MKCKGEATAANDIDGFADRIIYTVRSHLLKPYNKMPQEFSANMTKYFGEMNAQGLVTIDLLDDDCFQAIVFWQAG